MRLFALTGAAGVLLLVASSFACQQQGSITQELTQATPVSREPETVVSEHREPLNLPLKHPRLLVHKSQRRLDLFSNGRLLRSYKIGLGFNPVPDKEREGDGSTPEGEFYIFTKNPKSAYYLSLGISYPNIEDAKRGLRDGLITPTEHDRIVQAIRKKSSPPQNTQLGGLIYIHGHGASTDWTLGCIALENNEIKELYDAVEIGTPVFIEQ